MYSVIFPLSNFSVLLPLGLADDPGTDGLLPRRELHLHLAASSLWCDPCRPRRALARASAPAAERRAVCHSRLEPPASRTHTGLLLTRLSLALDSATWLPDLPRTIVARFVLRGLALQEPNATQAEAARHGDVLFVRARSVMLRENGPLQVHRIWLGCIHTAFALRAHRKSTAYPLHMHMRCSRSCFGLSARGGGSLRRASSARSATALHLTLRPSPQPGLARDPTAHPLPTPVPPRCHPGVLARLTWAADPGAGQGTSCYVSPRAASGR